MNLLDNIIDLLYPPRCAVCDDVLPWKVKYVCKDCRPKIVYVKEPTCFKCGKSLKDESEYCTDCKNGEHRFIQGVSVFDYGSVSDSIYRFKNKGRIEYAKYYAKEIYMRKKEWLKAINPDYLIPVPIHKSKLANRGYNQAEILANELSKLSKIPVNTTLITRCRKTLPLKDLSLLKRQNNLKKAFKVGSIGVKLSTIVIIDDIYTTGSTMDEISRSILERYDCNIYFITLTIGRGV